MSVCGGWCCAMLAQCIGGEGYTKRMTQDIFRDTDRYHTRLQRKNDEINYIQLYPYSDEKANE